MSSTYENAAESALLYQPVEELKNWAEDNKGRLPADQITKLKGIMDAIEDGPEAGKPLPISSLRDRQIQKIFGLGPDREGFRRIRQLIKGPQPSISHSVVVSTARQTRLVNVMWC